MWSTWNANQGSSTDRKLGHRLMGHDGKTADQHYVCDDVGASVMHSFRLMQENRKRPHTGNDYLQSPPKEIKIDRKRYLSENSSDSEPSFKKPKVSGDKLSSKEELIIKTIFPNRSGSLTKDEIKQKALKDFKFGEILEKLQKIKSKVKSCTSVEQRVFNHIRKIVYKT